MQEKEMLEAHVPQAIRDLIAIGHMDKIAEIMTGIDDFSMEKIATYLGTRMAQRRQRWRSVNDGLRAFQDLTRE
jgi:hypothetical protein